MSSRDVSIVEDRRYVESNVGFTGAATLRAGTRATVSRDRQTAVFFVSKANVVTRSKNRSNAVTSSIGWCVKRGRVKKKLVAFHGTDEKFSVRL